MTPGPSSTDSPERLVIASRQSQLALWQAEHVKAKLNALYPACQIDILGMTTEGDRILDRPLASIGGKGLFVKELEVALLERRADLAVHSLKDVPMELGDEFALPVIMRREDPRDAFVSSTYASLEHLPEGARVGTSSLRRASQVRHKFPQLQVLPLRGNVNTRLAKLDAGDYDAIILAAAGLKRLGLGDRIRALIPIDWSLPAAGQGALGIETLAGRPDLVRWLMPLADSGTHIEVSAERMVARRLGGNCRMPLAAYCITEADGRLRLRARVGAEDGSALCQTDLFSGAVSVSAAEAVGVQAAQALLDQGAGRWLGSS
ncbi:MAG: hydroxymethylbilane synthase [Pseudomonadota bacterium]|jgi:hydroxymethylbilane synthase